MKHKLEILRYCREVRRMLPCRGEQRRRIMEKIRAMVDHYAEENARVGYEDLVSRFGTPEQIASACLNEQDERIIIRDMRFGYRIVKIVAGLALAIALFWAATMGLVLVENYNSNEYVEVRISEGGKDWTMVESAPSGEHVTFWEWLEDLWFE